MPGHLTVVATPIGNLGDITLRALETLKIADMIACEDTRHTGQLLKHFGFHRPLVRYDDHTHERALPGLLSALAAGKHVALVTDAGTPGISDPGARLVRAARAAGAKVEPIPGASALLAALSGAGTGEKGFVFLGFLPRKPGPAGRLLQAALGLGKTVVLFESPFRVSATLERVAALFPDAPVTVARELTKLHEEFLQGTARQVAERLKANPPKGEAVLLIEPIDSPNPDDGDAQETSV